MTAGSGTRRGAISGYWVPHRAPGTGPPGLNQWPTLGVYVTDGRLTIDNAAAEQAIRPLCVGRRNWLHLAGDGGLQPTAVLLSVTASVKWHGLDPWAYPKHVLTELPARSACADLADWLPDRWAQSPAGPVAVSG